MSVGNLSLGGRGKTPVVGLLARWLVEAGERPAILTRGYGRRDREDGVVIVSDGVHLLADVDRGGDEPLMLARDVPGACVLTGELRALSGALAERMLGATVHLLDDGFQHLQLARDVDLVIVDERDLRDRPVPFGRLREPVEALKAADAVIVDGAGPAAGAFPRSFTLHRAIGDPIPLDADRPWSAPDRRVVAVAGIAAPARFACALEAHGWIVADRIDVPDHHQFTLADLDRIAAASARAGAPVLTTAKDACRLRPLRPLPMSVAYAPLSVAIEPAADFQAWLRARLAAARDLGAVRRTS